MPEFEFTELLPIGHDDTPYRQISAEGVSTVETALGRFVRVEPAVLDAEGISCTLNGLYLVDGDRHVDNHTTIDHAKPHCESHELYKGILDDRGRGVFNGKIFVREDAQKTDAKQTNKVVLLSDDATIDTKPQLEEGQMFYLQSRGIGGEHARAILLHAFAADIVERIEVEALRTHLEQLLLERLPID